MYWEVVPEIMSHLKLFISYVVMKIFNLDFGALVISAGTIRKKASALNQVSLRFPSRGIAINAPTRATSSPVVIFVSVVDPIAASCQRVEVRTARCCTDPLKVLGSGR